MATILAHIQIKPGKEARFEELQGALWRSTRADEPRTTRYEFFRGETEGSYYGLLSFEDFQAFLVHQSSDAHEEFGGQFGDVVQDIRVEWVDAVAGAIGAGRVGVRVSPFNAFNDLAATFEGEREEYLALVDALAARGIAYLSLIAAPGAVPDDVVDETRRRFPGTLILAGDYDATRAETDLAAGRADLIAFGRPFIANPDLPARLAQDAELNTPHPETFYGKGPVGYLDYPTL